MAQERITITIAPDTAEEVRAAAARSGVSVSAWMTERAKDGLRNQRLGEALDEYEAEYGAFTPEEIAEAEEFLHRKPGRWKGHTPS
jgi:hypothetical protein